MVRSVAWMLNMDAHGRGMGQVAGSMVDGRARGCHCTRHDTGHSVVTMVKTEVEG